MLTMEKIIDKLEQYQQRSGFEHTKYATREDSSGDTFYLTGWLGQVRITKDITDKYPVFKYGSKVSLFRHYVGLWHPVKTNIISYVFIFDWQLYRLFCCNNIKRDKITDLKRFLFE
ncbi:hypothetical protein SHVI106290_05455 [Shewanella violacea]